MYTTRLRFAPAAVLSSGTRYFQKQNATLTAERPFGWSGVWVLTGELWAGIRFDLFQSHIIPLVRATYGGSPVGRRLLEETPEGPYDRIWMVCSRSGHARDGRVGLRRPLQAIEKGHFRSSLHRKAQNSAVVVSLGGLRCLGNLVAAEGLEPSISNLWADGAGPDPVGG